jgi:hypothetical protein
VSSRLTAKELAAREYLVETTREFVRALLAIVSQDDDPSLDAIGNQRLRYVEALTSVALYLDKLGHDQIGQLGKYIGKLAVALSDLNEGVTDPLFVAAGSKRDSTRIWGARMQAVLGLECFIWGGLSQKTAAAQAAKDYRALAGLKRGGARDLRGSLLSWRERFLDGRVPVPELRRSFKLTYQQIEAATLSPEEYRKLGKEWLSSAAQSAKQ